MNTDLVFVLFANCLPVRGARRSAIFDVQRGRIRFIPNALYEILVCKPAFKQSPPTAENSHDVLRNSRVTEYFDVLTRESYGMWTDEPECFPPLSLEWRRPEAITNALIDLDRNSQHDWLKIRRELDDAGCGAVELRFYESYSLEDISSIISTLAGSRLRHVSLMLCYSAGISEADLQEWCIKWPVISSVRVHSSPQVAVFTLNTRVKIHFTKQVLTVRSCGQVSMAHMAVNLTHFTEAQKWNSCLNRKVGITADGQVASCPACTNRRTPADGDSLKSLVQDLGMQKLTQITKDEVTVCKHCEFRYVCTDCRVFVSDPLDDYSKPVHCSYDPYTATWADKTQTQISR